GEALAPHRPSHALRHRLNVTDGDRGIEFADLSCQVGADPRRIPRDPRHVPARKGAWKIDEESAIDVEAFLLDGTDNADDRDLLFRIEPHLLADGSLREKSIGKLLIDDR